MISGREILKIWLLRHGQNIYPELRDFPFLVTLYTPGYYLVCAAWLVATGNPALSASSVSFLSLIALCMAMGVWLRRETDRPWLALVTVGLFLVNPYIINTGLLARPDFSAWSLAILGTYLFLAPGREKPSQLQILAGCLVLCLGPFFKQQTLPIVLACATVCVFKPHLWKRCLGLAGMGLALGLASLAVLQLGTDGNFLTHSFLYPIKLAGDVSITNWSNAAERILEFTRQQFILLGLYGAALLYGFAQRRLHVLDWLILIHTPFLLKLVMTWGAASNYWWGMLALLFLRVGIFMGEVTNKLPVGPSIALVGLLALCPQSLAPSSWGAAFSARVPASDGLRLAEAIQRIDQGEVLINAEASPPLLSKDFTQRFQFFDSIETQFFEAVGLWRFIDSKMYRDISNKRFAAVVLGKTFMNHAIPLSILNYYHVDQTIGPYTLYKPLPGSTILYSVPTDQTVYSPPLTLRLTEIDGVYVKQSFNAFSISKTEEANLGYVVFTLDGLEPMRSVNVCFFPKVVHYGPGSMLSCEWSTDGVNFTNFLDYYGTINDMNSSLPHQRVKKAILLANKKVFIRFIIYGSAQLWFNREMPFAFIVNSE
ncbi:MAG: hypothetical protein HY795_11645 [Desulfovibrio sp.]|nr:hypothetical protein [Desulfovibrio sp.]MBI4958961.1 hypothetical protein [Desulfovibrio sp.]